MYINRITKEVEVNLTVAGRTFPGGLPEAVADELGYAIIINDPLPPPINGRNISRGAISETDGVFTQHWDIDDTNVDPMRELRLTRDARLTYSDYTHASDSTATVLGKAEWATYRQTLRDLPATYEDNPEDVIWPVSPDYSSSAGV